MSEIILTGRKTLIKKKKKKKKKKIKSNSMPRQGKSQVKQMPYSDLCLDLELAHASM